MNEELRKKIAALRRAGATEQDIDAFVAEYEGRQAAPATPAPTPTPTGPTDPEERAAYDRAGRYAKNYGMLDNALRVASFGFGDEIRSGIGAAKDAVTGAGSFGASYRGRQAAEQEGMDRFAKEHPKQALASSIAGGLTTAIGSGPATVAKTSAQALRGAVTSGAAYGAATGAGEARGTLGDRAKGAAAGGVVGGIAGGVLQSAASRIGKLFTRRTAAERADDLILDRMNQGGVSFDDATNAAMAARKAGKPVTLLDVGGKSMPRLGRDATAFPTKGGDDLLQMVEGRMTDQPGRVVGDLAATGRMTRVGSSREAIETLAEQRAELAKPMYDAIRDVPVRDPRLAPLFELPDFQKAYGVAQKVAQRRAAIGQGQPLPPFDPSKPTTVGILDQVKRGLDDVLYVGKRSPLEAGGMGPTERRSLEEARHFLVRIADEATTDPQTGRSAYASARAMYEGPTRLMEALDEGAARFLSPKTTAADIAATLKQMGSAEREAFKAGALDHIANRLDNAKSGRDVAALLNSPATDKKLQLLFDDPADYAAWRDRFAMESGFGATRNTVAAGSRTTPMARGAAEIEGGGPETLMAGLQSILSRSPAPLVRRGVTDRLAARARGVGTETADAIGQRLTQGYDNPDELLQVIQGLMRRKATPRIGPNVTRLARGVGQVVGSR